MEFLKNIALPQSAEHIELLHLLLIIVLFLFVPFICSIFGGTALSLYFKRRSRKSGDERYGRLSKEVMEIVTINKSVGFIYCNINLFSTLSKFRYFTFRLFRVYSCDCCYCSDFYLQLQVLVIN